MSKNAPSVAIMYGFGEGPWHGKKFRRALERSQFTPHDSPETADVIVAHSGGSYVLPETMRARLIILVNPPYWPEKSLLLSFSQKFQRDFIDAVHRRQVRFWLHKTFRNTGYIITKVPLSLRMRSLARMRYFSEQLPQTVLIRNRYDPWCSTDGNIFPKNWSLIHLPGHHDDLWEHPEAYISAIKLLSNNN